jgi:hypothetical protein
MQTLCASSPSCAPMTIVSGPVPRRPAITLTERQAAVPPALPEGPYEVPCQLDYYEDGYPEPRMSKAAMREPSWPSVLVFLLVSRRPGVKITSIIIMLAA